MLESEVKSPRVVNGVHFVWVPMYFEAMFTDHWLSINGKVQVRVFKVIGPGLQEWSVQCFEFGIFPDYIHGRYSGEDGCPVSIKASRGHTDEDEALSLAANFALKGV